MQSDDVMRAGIKRFLATKERLKNEAVEKYQRQLDNPELQRRLQEDCAERHRRNQEVLDHFHKQERERRDPEARRSALRSLEKYVAANKRFVGIIRACNSPEETEAQRKAIRFRVAKAGKAASLVAEYVEPKGPEALRLDYIRAAMAKARTEFATLLIAKLRRPRFDLPLLRELETEGCRFVVCGYKDLTAQTIGEVIRAATDEREAVSQRIKAGLEVKREALAREGKRLGNPNGASAIHKSGVGNANAVAALKAKANADAERIQAKLHRIDPFNRMSATEMASELNRRRLKGPRGGKWSAQSVIRLRQRLGALPS